MISLPDNLIKEAKFLQTGIERGQFNTNALLSFLKKLTAERKIKKQDPSKEELIHHLTEGLMRGRITKFKKSCSKN